MFIIKAYGKSELATTKDDNVYTKQQVKLMVEKWGEPGEYDGY